MPHIVTLTLLVQTHAGKVPVCAAIAVAAERLHAQAVRVPTRQRIGGAIGIHDAPLTQAVEQRDPLAKIEIAARELATRQETNKSNMGVIPALSRAATYAYFFFFNTPALPVRRTSSLRSASSHPSRLIETVSVGLCA
jgi:hypothetical protein